jgi:hypothetical protein
MDSAQTTSHDDHSVLEPARIGLAWLTTVGIDLFFNAGVFAPIFDQTREPALLADGALARRIPVAFVVLAAAVTALAWLLDATGMSGRRSVRVGAAMGLLLGLAGPVALWTALNVTGLFVAAGVVATTAEGAAAAAVLTSRRSGTELRVRVAVTFVVLAGLGQIVANVTGG